MTKRILASFGAVLMALGAASCQKLDSGRDQDGALKFELTGFQDAIPAELGRLVAVTSNDSRPNTAQLWFETADGTTSMVAVNFVDGKLAPNALTIPRK